MRLPAKPQSVKVARRLVHSCLPEWLHDLQRDIVVLLTSELVTNAVIHGGPHAAGAELGLEVTLTAGGVRVEVSDGGAGVPAVDGTGRDGLSGRGLLMVQALARQWGVRPELAGKSVWFEVDALPSP